MLYTLNLSSAVCKLYLSKKTNKQKKTNKCDSIKKDKKEGRQSGRLEGKKPNPAWVSWIQIQYY